MCECCFLFESQRDVGILVVTPGDVGADQRRGSPCPCRAPNRRRQASESAQVLPQSHAGQAGRACCPPQASRPRSKRACRRARWVCARIANLLVLGPALAVFLCSGLFLCDGFVSDFFLYSLFSGILLSFEAPSFLLAFEMALLLLMRSRIVAFPGSLCLLAVHLWARSCLRGIR